MSWLFASVTRDSLLLGIVAVPSSAAAAQLRVALPFVFSFMSDESVRIELDGIGGVIIGAMEKHLRDKLRSHGITSVEVKSVVKAGKPTIEFSGPEEDVKKARKYLGK